MKKLLLMPFSLLLIAQTSYPMQRENGKPKAELLAEETLYFCSICQEACHAETKITLQCTHEFCKACLFEWLANKYECPNCKGPINIDELEISPDEKIQIRRAYALHRPVLASDRAEAYAEMAASAADRAAAEPITNIQHLCVAIENENLEEIQRLLSEDPEIVNAIYNGESPLHIAARRNYHAGLNTLLGNGASLNEEDEEGKTALYLAVENGHIEATDLLLTRGATDDNFEYLLSMAIRIGIIPLINLLLPRIANINSVLDQETGFTALHIAAGAQDGPVYTEVVQFLLDRGAHASTRDARGLTVVDWARESGEREIIEILEGYELAESFLVAPGSPDDVEQGQHQDKRRRV